MIVIGNQLQASVSGVDVSGATFLLNDVILTRGVVFAYSAFFRSNKPIRFQIWRPSGNLKSFRLISETRVIPSVVLDREDVSIKGLSISNESEKDQRRGKKIKQQESIPVGQVPPCNCNSFNGHQIMLCDLGGGLCSEV